MSLGEPFEGSQKVLDWTRVRETHVIVLFSIFAFLVVLTFGLFLIFLIPDVPTLAIVSLIFQITLGMTLTRVYHSKGAQAKSLLGLIEPSSLNHRWRLKEVKVHTEEISRVFERMIIEAESVEEDTKDDTNDLAWFAVGVWSMASTIMVLIFGPRIILMLISAMVVSAILLGSYYSAYINAKNGTYSEYLTHLEYYVIAKTDYVSDTLGWKSQKLIEWKILDDSFILNDIKIEFKTRDPYVNIIYKLGLPKDEPEKFVVTFYDSIAFYETKEKLENKINTWNLRFSEESHEITIENISKEISLSRPHSFLKITILNEDIPKIADLLLDGCK